MMTLLPKQVGERFGVSAETVIGWVTAGLLPATDCSRPTAKRRRYRISEDDIIEFRRRRQAQSAAAQEVSHVGQ